ncbi:TRAP transporter large permease subunit [Arenimonas caeni]|jgi:tripartite ATP-independent transporter DctM subunit|uniref:TRAP transporter large permease n=1 Tax=Arenimonas caeni TaxID=2058085 RepID=UPI002A35E08B|nr:TRAP transporter large permease subunit [Arenimonas caeni]MDY0022666.1 TRAP transporter large permease subunit [Arenimonas caeni]
MSHDTLQVLMLVLLLAGLFAGLASGFPVAFVLGGVALLAAGTGLLLGVFDPSFLEAFPNRLFGVMTNETLVAVPLFVFMGVMLERSRIAEQLLEAVAALFGRVRGGLVVAVLLVGAVLAASTGIVGATVVAMGLISLPTMLRNGYCPRLASGAICASGTLGQIIPPSIVLVLLGDQLGNAYQQAQLKQGVFAPETVSVGDLFAGALIPGLGLVLLYLLYALWVAWRQPERAPALREASPRSLVQLLRAIVPALVLIGLVLGSILAGFATPTEAAAVGAVGATAFAALYGQLDRGRLAAVASQTVKVTSMVFAILVGAALFSLVFRGLGGDDWVHRALTALPGGKWGAILAVMLLMFLLGFVLDFIEIVFVVVPIVGPVLLALGVDPVWLGVMMAINLQTSFLTPPFGFALFYLRGVAPPTLTTGEIYRGVLPFIVLQLLMLAAVAAFPSLATALPDLLYG